MFDMNFRARSMTKLTPGERLHLMRLAAARTRRRALSRAMRTRALRWLAGPALADELLIVPQDLRTPDPSLFEELAAGQLGLGGAIVDLNGHSPFALVPVLRGSCPCANSLTSPCASARPPGDTVTRPRSSPLATCCCAHASGGGCENGPASTGGGGGGGCTTTSCS